MRLIDADAMIDRLKEWDTKDKTDKALYNFTLNRINEQPTIQPEPHWIPVTEANPTEDDDYWCTFGAESGWFVDWCSWYKGRWVWWNDDVPNPVSNVIAWCYPIEPYKGVTS